MKKYIIVVAIVATLLCCGACSQKESKNIHLDDEIDTFSWALGESVGRGIVNSGINLNEEVVVQALKHTLHNNEQPIDENTYHEAMNFLNTMAAHQQQRTNAAVLEKAQQQEQQLFDKLMKDNPKVKKAEQGFYYEVVRPGKGPKAKFAQIVNFDYKAYTMPDNKLFDQTYGQRDPIATTVGNQMFDGLREGFQIMEAGSIYRFYFPFELAFGNQASEDVPAYTPVIYEVELHSISD